MLGKVSPPLPQALKVAQSKRVESQGLAKGRAMEWTFLFIVVTFLGAWQFRGIKGKEAQSKSMGLGAASVFFAQDTGCLDHLL